MDSARHNTAKLNALTQAFKAVSQADYPISSRVHKLRSFAGASAQWYVKRDDELGFGCSGSKFRKYRSLIPFFKSNGYHEVAVIGGAYSNNVLGISQLLIENGMAPVLFLKGDSSQELRGNALLTSVLAGPSGMHWVPRQDWARAVALAQGYAEGRLAEGKKVFVLPEGASVKEALPGCLSLPLDILRNEHENEMQFDRIFIDAGTGMTACALLLAFAWIEKKTQVDILLLAEGENEFRHALEVFHKDFEAFLGEPCPLPARYRCYRPHTAASFGAVNGKVLREVKTIAKTEGFLTDPVYSAKLFAEARRMTAAENPAGRILLIHSGGALTLSGFQEQLRALGSDIKALP